MVNNFFDFFSCLDFVIMYTNVAYIFAWIWAALRDI